MSAAELDEAASPEAAVVESFGTALLILLGTGVAVVALLAIVVFVLLGRVSSLGDALRTEQDAGKDRRAIDLAQSRALETQSRVTELTLRLALATTPAERAAITGELDAAEAAAATARADLAAARATAARHEAERSGSPSSSPATTSAPRGPPPSSPPTTSRPAPPPTLLPPVTVPPAVCRVVPLCGQRVAQHGHVR